MEGRGPVAENPPLGLRSGETNPPEPVHSLTPTWDQYRKRVFREQLIASMTTVDMRPGEINVFDEEGSTEDVHRHHGTITLAPGCNLVVWVRIGTRVFKLTVDAGAGRSIIRAGLARELREQPETQLSAHQRL